MSAEDPSAGVVRGILDAVPIRVFWKDRDGRYLGCNALFARDAGVSSPQEILGKQDHELAWRDQAHLYRADDLEVMRSKRAKLGYEEQQTNAVGGQIWLRTSKVPLLDRAGQVTGVLGIYDDVTEQHEARERLHFAHFVSERAPDGIAWFDRNGHFHHVNEALCRMLGLEPGALREQSISNIEVDCDAECWDRRWAELSSGFGSPVLEVRYRHADGSLREVEVSASYVAFGDKAFVIAHVRDVGARLLAAKQLSESEGRLRALVEQSPLAIQIVAPDGRTRAVNAAYSRLFGVTLEGLAGYNLLEDPQLGRLGRSDLVRRAFLGEPTESPAVEYDRAGTPGVVGPQGKVWVRTLLYPVLSTSGEVTEVVLLHEDLSDRMRAEAALRENERRFRELFALSPDPNWIVDDSNTFILANEAAAKVFGYDSPAQIVALHPSDISPPFQPDGRSSSDAADAMMEVAREKGVHRFEWLHRRRDGSDFPVEITLASVEVGGRRVLHCTGRDISARKAAERELIAAKNLQAEISERFRESTEFLERLIASANEGVTVSYRSETFPFATFAVWNARMVEITGYTQEEINRLGFFESLYPDPALRAAAIARVARARAGEDFSAEEWQITRKDGTKRTIALSTSMMELGERGLAIVGMIHDVTKRKLADEALQASEERFRGIFDGSNAAIFLFDGEQRFIDANRAGMDLLGYTKPELLRLRFLDVSASPHPPRGLVFDHGAIVNQEHRLRRKDGEIVTALVNARQILAGDGEVTGIQSTLLDVSELHRAREERERLQQLLGSAQKMESVGRLAGGVAHDFNNMLGVILGSVELALESVESGSAIHADLHQIQEAAERSSELTHQLLAFARRQPATPVALDLNEKIDGTLKMLRRLIGENITLEFRPSAEPQTVKMDPSQIDQVLTNLCVNAKDAISGLGRIAIETTLITLDDDDCSQLPGASPGRYTRLVFSDDGCGMDAKVLAHIFEPFFTTKRVGKGTGLGLATAYGIVRQNGGFIDVASRVDEGTTFTIYLPAHDTTIPSEPAPRVALPQRGTETVLLVEDEPALSQLNRRMLERLGYSTLIANSPGEALALAASFEGTIDLLMTDVIMPEMSGLELSRRLQVSRPGLRLLFMSGYTADVISRDGLIDEGVGFLPKPFALRELAAKLREVLDSNDDPS